MTEQIYKNKYLKYKSKYVELKQQTGGLFTFKSGDYLYLTNNKYIEKLNLKKGGDGPSVNELNTKLHFSYRIPKGGKELEKIKNNDERFANVVDKTTTVVAAVALTTAKIASDAAIGFIAPGVTGNNFTGSTIEYESVSNNIKTTIIFDGKLETIQKYIALINNTVPNKVNVAFILQVNKLGKNKIIELYNF
jgi:hypothetical protein